MRSLQREGRFDQAEPLLPVRRDSVPVSLNRVTILLGPSEYGKSTIIRTLALEHLNSHPRALALIHDPHWDFDDVGKKYKTAAEVRAAYQASRVEGGPVFARGAAVRGSSSELRDLAVEMGERSNTKDRVTTPIFFAVDETSLMDGSSKTYAEKADLALLSNRRHYGIHVAMGVQEVTNLTAVWFKQATEVYILSQGTIEAVRELEKRIGLPKGKLDRTLNAPRFKFLTWRRGEGLV